MIRYTGLLTFYVNNNASLSLEIQIMHRRYLEFSHRNSHVGEFYHTLYSAYAPLNIFQMQNPFHSSNKPTIFETQNSFRFRICFYNGVNETRALIESIKQTIINPTKVLCVSIELLWLSSNQCSKVFCLYLHCPGYCLLCEKLL